MINPGCLVTAICNRGYINLLTSVSFRQQYSFICFVKRKSQWKSYKYAVVFLNIFLKQKKHNG